MYLLPKAGDARGYFPINTKWGGTSSIQKGTLGCGARMMGLMPGGGLRYFQRPATLSYFRPNFAMSRGNYPGNQYVGAPSLGQEWKAEGIAADKWYLGRMGDLTVDPTLLLGGIGTLALAMFLFGSKKGPAMRKRKAAKLRKKLRTLEAES